MLQGLPIMLRIESSVLTMACEALCFLLPGPGAGKPGRLPSMGPHRVGHD